MKFIKSNFTKKLIIILITLMIFNMAVPKEAKAWDLMGIIAKPIYSVCLGTLVVTDTTLGLLLTGISAPLNLIGALVDAIMADEGTALSGANSALQKIFIGPDTIFTGQVTMLNANIFDYLDGADADVCVCVDSNWDGKIKSDEINSSCELHSIVASIGGVVGDSLDEASQKIQPGSNMVNITAKAVARIYVILRNLCGLVMLAGLIFTGIRILLSSNNPQKKNEWLVYLQDWLIGMGLLIFSHIIMILIFEVSDSIVKSMSANLSGFGGLNFALIKECLLSFDNAEQLICIILLTYLLWLTIVFVVAYFKRFFWICILIVFAPVFSVMYAFGRQTKQIYSNWLKEFILTVFVQPFHLVVYTVLISIPMSMTNSDGAFSLDGTFEIIYALIAMSFIRPAEKYLRGLFGMDKGVANIASYDSGKQTIDAAKQAVEKIAKTAVSVVAAVYTGGASTAAGAAGGTEGVSGALGTGGGNALGGLLQSGEGKEGLSNNGLQNYLNDGFGQNALGEYYNPYTDEYDQNYNPLNDPAYNGEPIDKSDEGMKEAIAQGMSEGQLDSTSSNMNAANVTITAGSVEMQGELENKNNEDIENIEAALKATLEEAKAETSEDDSIELEEGEKRFRDKLLSGFEIVRDSGLGNELYKGAHSVMDTLYVTAPPDDWKKTAENRDSKRKERVEREKDNWAHNKTNINIMTEKYMPAYMEEMKKKYKGMDEGFIEGKAREKAEEKAKKALKDMSVFVPYGVKDLNKAYELYKDSNDYGYTPEQAIRQRAGFEKFNNNSANVAHINQHYDVNCTTVSEAIPNAKVYYNNGYTNISDMNWVNYMADKLEKSPQFAMKVDQELRKKSKGGKINYNGKNKEMAEVIKQINQHYEG